MRRPVNRMSLACAAPMSRGSSQLAPSSVLVSPFTMPVALNTADSDAMRRSAPRLRHMPPPKATPLIAAMIGCGMWRMIGISCE